MKLNIDGMSQLEIEEMLSVEEMYEELQLAVELFYNQMDDEDIEYFSKVLDGNDPEEVLCYTIGLIGNSEFGIKRHSPFKHRLIGAEILAKAIANSRGMKELYPLPEERYPKALNLVGAMDTVMYDIDLARIEIEDGQWRTLTQCMVGFDLDAKVQLITRMGAHSLPMIEKPDEWKVGHSGGYQLTNSKCTLNKGEAEQPQECLDVLNTLQANTYRLTDNAELQELQNYVYTKQLIKYPEHFANEITKHVTTTAGILFDTFKNREFHFEWKFDFRGRLYSTGYDINLQSDKYRKGIIQPIIKEN